MATNNENSFHRGWEQLRVKDVGIVRTKLRAALEVTTIQGFKDRLFGRVLFDVLQRKAVEDIFAEYGITDVWGVY